MQVIERRSKLWRYLPEEIRGLIEDGEHLLIECHAISGKVSDYSYLVFPFAKAYEGFLKHLFLDLELIHEEDFYGDDIRIGRVLNPIFSEKKGSVYKRLKEYSSNGKKVADRLWNIWTHGRNQIFHYFPHNFRRIGNHEANEIIKEFIGSMEAAVEVLNSHK